MGSNVGVAERVVADFVIAGEFFCGGVANLKDQSLWEIGVKLKIGDLAVETENNGDRDFIVTISILVAGDWAIAAGRNDGSTRI